MKKKLNMYIPINTLGFGCHSVNMLKALTDLGVTVNLSQIGQGQQLPYYNKYITQGFNSYVNKKYPSLYIFHNEHMEQFSGSPQVGFSIFETTKLNPKALYNLQHNVDRIFVTTQRHKELLIEQNITKQIDIINEGSDPELFNTKKCQKYINTGKFTYITVGKLEKRKNTDVIVRTFIETSQYKQTALICHTFNPFIKKKDKLGINCFTNIDIEKYGFSLKENNPKYIKLSNGMCDIYFTKYISDVTNIRSLYRSSNVGIQIPASGAWELGINEMMACGIPVIVSRVLGPKEYLDRAPMIQQKLIIEPCGTEIADDKLWFRGDVGYWSKLNPDDLADLIEDTYDESYKYEHPNVELSKFYHDNYNWSIPAKKVIDLLL